MDIYKILYNIIENPTAIKNYRLLLNYYKSKNMFNEAEAVLFLINKKSNVEESNNSTYDDSK